MTPAEIKRIEDSFLSQSMMTTFGATLASVNRGVIEIDAPILPGARQQHGVGHAGLTFSIGDSAAGYAALTTLPLTAEVMTAEIKINLLAPAMGDFLRAKGRVIKAGRRLIVVSSDIFAIKNGRETLIAIMQGTMVPV